MVLVGTLMIYPQNVPRVVSVVNMMVSWVETYCSKCGFDGLKKGTREWLTVFVATGTRFNTSMRSAMKTLRSHMAKTRSAENTSAHVRGGQ